MSSNNNTIPDSVISSPETVSQGFHIGGIFIILVAGFLGVFAPPLLVHRKWLSIKSTKFIIGKAFSAGIILGVGFVHMLPDAQNQLASSMPEYPYSGLFAGLAAAVSLLIEQMALTLIKNMMTKDNHNNHHNHNHNHKAAEEDNEIPKENKIEMVHLHSDAKEPSKNDIPTTGVRPILEHEDSSPGLPNTLNCNKDHCDDQECGPPKVELGKPCDCDHPVYKSDQDYIDKHKEGNHNGIMNILPHNHEHEHEHGHGEEGHTHGVMGLYTDEELFKRVNSFTIAHVLEIGVAFHSIIIGIALSVERDLAKFDALLIAICFHQFFEGLALGSSIQGAKITSFMHVGIMTAIFSLSTPAGQAIGLGVASLYDDASATAQETQGIFDSISGGILLYMALVDLIGEDFKKSYKGCLQMWMVLAVFLGFGFMCVLAIWA